MGLLDRFKPQPRWKHPDPDVRAAGVRDVPDDELEVLIGIAREDADARVRRLAVSRLTDPATLADVARADQDEGVREQARDILVQVALRADGPENAAGEAALAALTEPRQIALIAKEAASEAISIAALARLSDARSLGTVARQATHPATRLQALGRIADESDLTAVALNSEHKDVALAALERLTDPAALDAIANRARNRVVGRRARASLRALEDAKRAPGPETIAARRRTDRLDVCQMVESFGASADWNAMPDLLADAEQKWDEVNREAGDEDAELTARFAAAVRAARDRLDRHEREMAEAARRADEHAREIAARQKLCEAVHALEGEDALERLAIARAEWEGLPAVAHPGATVLQQRFEDATRECERRFQQWQAGREVRARLESQLADFEPVLDTLDLAEARPRWSTVRKTWAELGTLTDADDELARRLHEAERRLNVRDTAGREERVRRQRENLARFQNVAAQLEGLARTERITLKQAERAVREVRNVLAHLGSRPADVPKTEGDAAPPPADQPAGPAAEAGAGPDVVLPSKRDRDELVVRFKAVQGVLYPKLQELREADDWQRWANADVQEKLCARAEALLDVTDLADAARQLRDLQQQWKQASAAPRSRAEALWHRFKRAGDTVRARCETYFAEQAAEKARNLQRKIALCEEVEALAASSDWAKTADEIKKRQAEWKTIGPALQEKTTWERFRSACDRFFTRRKEDLDHRKQQWSANLARKEALCAQVEALVESTEWEKTTAEIRRLQAEWKTVGPVRRNRSEAIWNRFRAACDRFFERYQHRDRIALDAAGAEREALCASLENLIPDSGSADAGPPAEELLAKVQDLRRRWQQAPALPGDQAYRLNARFVDALSRLAQAYPAVFRGTDLDIEGNRRKMEALVSRVEGFLLIKAGAPAEASPVAVLATQLREALAANTIGGKVDEELKWRSAVEDVKQAQVAWRRIGPVPPEIGRALAQRFEKACAKFFDQRRKH